MQVPTWKFQTILNTHKIKRGNEKPKDKKETYLRASFLYAVLISWSVESLDTDNTSYGSRRLAGVDGPSIFEPIPIYYPFSLFLFKHRAAPKVIKKRPLCFRNSVACYSSTQLPQDSNSKANKMFPAKEDGTRFKAALDRSWVGFFPRNGKKQKICDVEFGI